MSEHDDILDRVVETLRRPVRTDPALTARVMAEIASDGPVREAAPAAWRRWWAWWRRPWTIRITPLGTMATAVAVLAVAIVGPQLAVDEVALPVVPPGSVIQFVLVAPEARSVVVVGDFNDWSTSSTPLTRAQGDGVWSAEVPLGPGRYRYSFLVDGTTWVSDPGAATALADEFGRPNSVVTIGGA